jgi:hypothetical protein
MITNELVLVKPIRNVTCNILVAVAMKINNLGCDDLQHGTYVPSTCRINGMKHIPLKNYDLPTYSVTTCITVMLMNHKTTVTV